ncbi:hypothetical protein PIB30_009897 [Stylosanthes scabra]|uniref:PB1-like domain-containing protein n=1 Tax=Stylosanthes scabra TaxID=79078 RepID=A0ABU6S541_9FABA|nr:hypothetical protein [Stylosanthes scabra]
MVHVFNVGGKLCENDNGVLKHVDGMGYRFEVLDVDLLSISVLEEMAKSLGFSSYSAMHWLVPNAANSEFGLRRIKKDSDLIELRNSLVENQYVGCVNMDSDADEKSSSDDSYESAEDEAYKPPPDGYELSNDSDGGGSKKVKKKGTTKIIMTPTKKNFPKKKPRKTPTKKTRKVMGQVITQVKGRMMSPVKEWVGLVMVQRPLL